MAKAGEGDDAGKDICVEVPVSEFSIAAAEWDYSITPDEEAVYH